MSSSTIEYTVAAQERTLSALRQSQDAVVELVETWAKAVDNAAPQRPALPVPAGVPTADEMIQTSFAFADQLLAVQRAFAGNLVQAAAPAVTTEPVSTPVA